MIIYKLTIEKDCSIFEDYFGSFELLVRVHIRSCNLSWDAKNRLINKDTRTERGTDGERWTITRVNVTC